MPPFDQFIVYNPEIRTSRNWMLHCNPSEVVKFREDVEEKVISTFCYYIIDMENLGFDGQCVLVVLSVYHTIVPQCVHVQSTLPQSQYEKIWPKWTI